MKVIDLQLYRSQKAVKVLEQRIADIIFTSQVGTASQIKQCFREWLQKTNAI